MSFNSFRVLLYCAVEVTVEITGRIIVTWNRGRGGGEGGHAPSIEEHAPIYGSVTGGIALGGTHGGRGRIAAAVRVRATQHVLLWAGVAWRGVVPGRTPAVTIVTLVRGHVAIYGSVGHKGAVGIFGRLEFHFCLFCLAFVFHSPVLEPGFDLHVRQLQFLC